MENASIPMLRPLIHLGFANAVADNFFPPKSFHLDNEDLSTVISTKRVHPRSVSGKK